MIKELVATLLLSGSIGVKAPIQPKRVNEDYFVINGVYNFCETFDFTKLGYDDYEVNIVFEDVNDLAYTTPITFNNDYASDNFYLAGIQIHAYDIIDVDVTFYYYDSYLTQYTEEITIERGDDFQDFGIKALMFYCHRTIILHDDDAIIFSNIFTTEDNSLVTSYTGYYSFFSSQTTANHFFVYGSCLFNNEMYYGFTSHGVESTSVKFFYYDVNELYYTTRDYVLPLNGGNITNRNILCTNCKMSVQSKDHLSNIGLFSYVRDTSYDNTDFKDLMFSVMDSPIYMLSRLLGFELFGVNLYIALASLLTIVALLVLIRKFF